MESLQSVGECLNRINSKHDALVALIEIMSKHKIIFNASKEIDTERGKNLTQLKKIYASLNKKDNDDGDVWNWNEHCFNKNFRNCPRFLFNSLFCEYAYIINLDDRMLEFYVGFNENPDARGRYAGTTVDDEKKYYGVILAQTIPLIDCYKGKWRISKNGGGFVKA